MKRYATILPLLALLVLGCGRGYRVPALVPLAKGETPAAMKELKPGMSFALDKTLEAGKINVIYFGADW